MHSLKRALAPKGQRGAALLEFAVVLPLFLVLVFAIVDFGLYFFAKHTVQFATREGVRLALVGRTLVDDQGNPMGREASIVQTIHQRAAIAVNPSRLQISIYPLASDYSDPPGSSGKLDAGGAGDYMRVRVQTEYRFITPFVGAVFNHGVLPVRAEATYRNERF